MKKSLSRLIIAVLALALSIGASAQATGIAKKATTRQHLAAQKLDDVQKTKKFKPLAQHRTIDRTANGLMKRAKRMTSPTWKARQMPSLLPARAAASSPLMGSCLYADNIETADYVGGIYNIPTNGSTIPEVMIECNFDASFGGYAADGFAYMTSMEEFWGYTFIYHAIVDLETGEVETINGSGYDELATDLAYDPTSGKVYGCFYNEEATGFNFGTMNQNTWACEPICPIADMWNACACDAHGNLFAIDRSGALYSVDKATGEQTEIGDTGLQPYYTSSAAIDPKTGVMYLSYSPLDENGYLYAIDTATAQATMVCQYEYNNEFAGLFFVAPLAADDAPAAIEDLAAEFDGDALTGQVFFTAPSTLYDGSNPTDANLVYTIAIDGETVAEGRTQYGAAVSETVTVHEAGEYTITAYVSNAAADGPKAKITLWVGQDKPEAPVHFECEYTDGIANLSWDPVTKGVHGGYVGDVTYKVVRHCSNGDKETVAEGLTSCSYSEPLTEGAAMLTYTYVVYAVAGDMESAPAFSGSITLGSIVPPYSIDFTTATSIDGYTVIDANEDGKAWTLTDGQGVRMNYNSDMDMDDWLVTPAITLEGGKLYTFTFAAHAASNNYPERIEAAFADSPTAWALSANIIVEPEELTAEGGEFSAMVAPEADGKYYFGLHGISYVNQYYLYVTSLSVSAPTATTGPVAPTELKVEAAADGSKSAVVSFIAPDKNIVGSPITSLVSATILVNGDEAAVIASPTPGAEVSSTITVPSSGTYTIEAYATSSEGNGLKATTKAYIGVNIPAAPTNVVATEIGNSGQVVITWDAPTTDKDGFPISADLITYTVVNYFNEVLAEGITDTRVEVTAWTGEGQTFDYFDVTAVTEAGSSSPASSPMIAIGEPYDMPVYESFTDGNFDCGMGAIDNGAEWYVFDESTYEYLMGEQMSDADGTNGFAMMYGTSQYATADLFTAKINVSGKSPVVSFAYFTIDAEDENYLDVLVKEVGGDMHHLGEYQMSDGVVNEWTTVQISLANYVGKDVQIYFRGGVLTYTMIFVDAIAVKNLADYDLAIDGIEAPAAVAPGQEFDINVRVSNEGAQDISDYTVELSLNGEVIGTAAGEPIASGTKATVGFAHTFTAVSAEENVFEARVVCDLDEVADNNSVEIPVILTIPNYPCATNLTAESTSAGVALAWEAPDMANLPKEAVTDDFESCTPFATEAEPWTLVDADGAQIGGIGGIDLGVSACAYFVMDNSDESTFNNSFAAHSGHQYMSTMYNANGSQQSDWMISPALSGDAQTISLYAKSYTATYGLETLSIYYSTTDANPDSFTMISTHQVPDEWTEYTAALPAGAAYFAIVCESQDVFMLFIDDVTYIPADGADMELTLLGYNVYRDGMKINDAPVEATEYVDEVAFGTHEYQVTVVYAQGESAPSNKVGLTTALASIASGAKVMVKNRNIVVDGAEGQISIFTADGKMVFAETAAHASVAVAPGVYMVKAGKRVSKVIVR